MPNSPMSSTTTTAEATSEPTQAEIDADFTRDVLLDLTNLARDFARLLLDTARRGCKPDDILRLHAAFDRAARSARRSLLLYRHLKKPPPQTEPERRRHARDHIQRTVERAIAAAPLEPGERESRRAELLDRLDTIETEADLLNRPLPEIIAELKHELGLVFEALSQPIERRQPEYRTPTIQPPDG